MNYLGILLEYLRSVECKFSPLGDLSGGTHTHAIAYGVSLLLSCTGMVSVQGCQNAPATGAIAGYSEVFAGCKLLEKSEK